MMKLKECAEEENLVIKMMMMMMMEEKKKDRYNVVCVYMSERVKCERE